MTNKEATQAALQRVGAEEIATGGYVGTYTRPFGGALVATQIEPTRERAIRQARLWVGRSSRDTGAWDWVPHPEFPGLFREVRRGQLS